MKNPKTLIIEDMQSMRDALSSILKAIGLTKIDKAVDGNDGYTKALTAHAEGEPYDLILCDVNMPECDGITFLKKVSESEYLKDSRIIMVSTENEYSVVIEAIGAGARDYILKPFTQDTVLKKLKRFL